MLTRKQRRAEAAFQQTVRRYLQAAGANVRNGLVIAREEFQSIVLSGGPHADRAQLYLTEIKKQLDVLAEPPRHLHPLRRRHAGEPSTSPNSSYNITSASIGIKVRSFPRLSRLVLTGNVLVRLDDRGLRSKPVPLAGVRYTF